jgi:DNA-binding Lrp family transcriptional regulator
VPGNVSEQSRTRVLQALRDDGRASFARIATKAGLARHQVASIVQTALARDELRLTVSINPGLLGLERFAYLQITVSGPAQPVREALVSMSETTFVADVAGRSSVDAEVRVGPDPHLKRTLDSIRQLPGVSDIRTTLYESIEVNRFSPFPTAAAPLTIDEADRAIIRHLHTDARASYRQLGEASGLSPQWSASALRPTEQRWGDQGRRHSRTRRSARDAHIGFGTSILRTSRRAAAAAGCPPARVLGGLRRCL